MPRVRDRKLALLRPFIAPMFMNPISTRTKSRASCTLLFSICIFTSFPDATHADERKIVPHPLVAAQSGTLPIILSAPHGGTAKIPGVPERTGEGIERSGKGFAAVRDDGTEELAHEISNAIEQRLGKKPYSVIAGFHRRYIDANRPPDIAYEDAAAKPTYDAYHDTLRSFAREVHNTFGRGLVLDIHGQKVASDTIFRGTGNGRTVALLSKQFGIGAHAGPKSFFGLLGAAGCKVHPSDDGAEQPGLTGGFIVQTYGGAGHFGLDAIQLEFGADYRAKANLKATAAKVADAVAAFTKLYLPAEPMRQ